MTAHVHVFDRDVFVEPGVALRCACVGNVAVDPAQRGRGMAGRLMQECLADCAGAGFAISLLHTHLPRVYAASGYTVLPQQETLVEASGGVAWHAVRADAPLQMAYEAEHGGRPGTVRRDAAWWVARENWLRPEGWRLLGVDGASGYCSVRWYPGGGEVDEAVGECAHIARVSPPAPGRWIVRDVLGPELVDTGSDAVRMGLALQSGVDLQPLARPGSVSWRSDEF